ncbi:MAG: rod shape-determining protein MreC, partial [Candidatus Cloacimonadota bacterium]|nr:rod shape-determining protein MreC [Candidatus Cloacimonadota bacterium]
IKIGDKIITSSLSSIYPPGIPLGEIIKISETKNSLFMEAEIQPFVNIEQVEEVGILELNSD